MTTTTTQLNNIEQIFKAIKSADATGDLIVDSKTSLSLSANQGKLDKHQVSSTQIYGVRVIKDSRVGIAYSEAADSESLKLMVAQALENAEYADEEIHESIANNSNNATLKTDDALLCPADDTSIDAKIDLVLELEGGLTAKTEMQSVPYNGLQDGYQSRDLYTSSGFAAHSQQRVTALYAYGLAEVAEKNAIVGHGQVSRQASAFSPETIIDTVYKNCLSMLDGTPISSGRYDVIFDTDTLPNLIAAFGMAFSAKSAKDGKNPWRDKLNEQVADSSLTLLDDPTLTEGMGYSLFDAEGSKAQQVEIIRTGELQTLLHNSATASYFARQTTGNAQRSAKTSLGIDLHQLSIATGHSSTAELMAGTTVEITDLTGTHSGANPISGDFSFGASGYLCRDGKRQQAIRGITVAGNFYKMLQQISAIGDQRYWNWEKTSYTPLIRFADLAISGS
jgi:PmbA protein